jgi:DNA-binding CsgD family transcriptional regulator
MDHGEPTPRWGYDPIGDESHSRPARRLVVFCCSDRRLGCPRLGSRELQVLARLEAAKAYKEIAIGLSVSESLVHKLVHRVFLRLCAHNRTEALARWWACCACPNADWRAACRAVSAPGSETTRVQPRRPARDAASQDQAVRP